jgi:hypothetical protein
MDEHTALEQMCLCRLLHLCRVGAEFLHRCQVLLRRRTVLGGDTQGCHHAGRLNYGGWILALSYSPGGRAGGWQP